MKKVGLKAIAAALALLMTASLSAPAAAEAADKLLATSAGGNVLVITQDMVDSEGEFVLSGEVFDKVVLPSDVEIKRLYIDNCEIGEVTVESGNNPTVQLWEAKIGTVTVSAAELVDENAALKEYIELMNGNTKDYDVAKFFQEVQAKNKSLAALAPTIALKGGADSAQEIGAITVSGNAKVNFKDGKNPAAFNIAYASAKEDMEVVVENYNGDINVEQTTAAGAAYGYLDVKTKNSEVNVNVKAAGNANIALRSTGSKTANVNFVSNGKALLTLASPVENLKVEGNSSNGTVKVLTSLVSADVQGKGMTLNLGPAATVEKATVAGSDNKVNGTGDLLDCTIPEGSTASVEVMGAFVVGNNTYQPLVTEPYEFPTYGEETAEETYTFAQMTQPMDKGGNWSCTPTIEGGKLILTSEEGQVYTQSFWQFPVDMTKVNKITFNGVDATGVEFRIMTADEYAAYNGGQSFEFQGSETTYTTNGAPLAYFAVVSKDGGLVTIESITFEMKGGASAVTTKTYGATDLGPYLASWGDVASVMEKDEAAKKVTFTMNGNYHHVVFPITDTIKLGDYQKMVIKLSENTSSNVGVEVYKGDTSDAANMLGFWWNINSTGDIVLAYDKLGYGSNESIAEEALNAAVAYVVVKNATENDPGKVVTIDSITFVAP